MAKSELGNNMSQSIASKTRLLGFYFIPKSFLHITDEKVSKVLYLTAIVFNDLDCILKTHS